MYNTVFFLWIFHTRKYVSDVTLWKVLRAPSASSHVVKYFEIHVRGFGDSCFENPQHEAILDFDHGLEKLVLILFFFQEMVRKKERERE